MNMIVPLSVDVWYRLWREQLIDDIALTRITVITETSELSIPYAKMCFLSTNNLILLIIKILL